MSQKRIKHKKGLGRPNPALVKEIRELLADAKDIQQQDVFQFVMSAASNELIRALSSDTHYPIILAVGLKSLEETGSPTSEVKGDMPEVTQWTNKVLRWSVIEELRRHELARVTEYPNNLLSSDGSVEFNIGSPIPPELTPKAKDILIWARERDAESQQ